jgi:hypothetical protein
MLPLSSGYEIVTIDNEWISFADLWVAYIISCLTLPRLKRGEFFFHSVTLPVFRLRRELVEGDCPEALSPPADGAVSVCPTVRDALAKMLMAAL